MDDDNLSGKWSIVIILLLVSFISFACSLFTRKLTIIEDPETYFEPNFEPVTEPLIIDPVDLLPARLGVVYETEIHITQNVTPVGEVILYDGALPPGLELSFMQGEDAAKISGMPEEEGTFSFTLFVWCYGTQVSGQTLLKDYVIVVEE